MTCQKLLHESIVSAASKFTHLFESRLDRRRKGLAHVELKFEELETRSVLSANLGAVAAPTGPDASLVGDANFPAEVETAASSITIAVNGEKQVVDLNNPRLQLAAGDVLEVVQIGVDSTAREGVFAVEGYVNVLNDASSPSTINYADGRFSLRESNFEANGSSGLVEGLDGKWEVQTGWDRLTLVVVHYTADGSATAATSQVQLQVDSGDFAFDEASFKQLSEADARVGEGFDIFGRWFNNGEGAYSNYAEVDIYHESNLNEIVWAGALEGTLKPGGEVEGLFVNNRADDGFSETFTPELAGGYVLKFYLDPEATVTETNEANNRLDVRINVSEADVPNQNAAGDTRVFREVDSLKLTFVNEQQFAFGFGIQNTTNQVVENWAVEIQGANYKLDAGSLTNSSSFELFTTQNEDGTYNHLFVGTAPLGPHRGLPGGIQFNGVNFGFEADSDSFRVGILS